MTDQQQLTDYIQLYTKPDRTIDKEALRRYVQQNFERDIQWTRYLINRPTHKKNWDNLHDYIYSTPQSQEIWKIGWTNLSSVEQQMQCWHDDHVAEPASLEFSLKQKAVEISSGDEDYDYYMALMIRHDQLLAATHTFKQAIKHLAWITENPDAPAIVASQQFNYFCNQTIESRIYAFAEQMYHLREQLWE